jgi:hypothetical protein
MIEVTDFETWVALLLAGRTAVTAHAVLLKDAEAGFQPVCGTWVELSAEAEWGEMVILFAGAGLSWDAVAFFAADGVMDHPAALRRMQALETELDAEPRLLGEAEVFWPHGGRVSADRLG